MSILIAYKKGDTVFMGTDTRVIVDDSKRNDLCECNYKIQKLENGMLLGITSDRLERQTIFANSEIFTLDKNGKLTKKHIVKEIIPNLLSVLGPENLIVEKEGELPYAKVMLLLAYKDVLYEICSGFTVIKYENFQALGRAADFAQATMANTKESDDVNVRIVKALDIASKNSQLVGKPYLLIDTKELKYTLVGGNE